MRLINKIVATTALNIAAISATSANAETLLVSYAPVTDMRGSFSFNVDSNPIPLNSFTTTFATAISNGMGEFAGITTTISMCSHQPVCSVTTTADRLSPARRLPR